MARLPRLVIPHHPHHVTQFAVDKQVIFRDHEDYRVFLNWLREAIKLYKLAIHAYVLMPTHIHFLATPTDSEGLARTMQWVGRHYVPYFNRKYGRSGTLWQGRFRATVVDAAHYLLTCTRFIELNPVRAGLVAQAADYEWSSYQHHIGAKPDALITEHPVFWALGNTPFARDLAYRHLTEQALTSKELQELTETTRKDWALGSEPFKKQLETQINRRVSPGKRGRPVKPKSKSEEPQSA
jgi:putative transposase